MYDVVVVRYGEIFLKSEYVKRRFEDILVENIRRMLERRQLEGRIRRSRHRIYIESKNAEEVAYAVSRVFGVVSSSPAKKTTADVEKITEECLKVAKEFFVGNKSFSVEAKRTGKHSFSSIDLEKAVASVVIKEMGLRVNLENPEKTIYVEVLGDEAYVFDRKISGVGGLPYRSQGKVVVLVSSGIDSPVAAWMMMRRGCEIIALHFGEEDDVMDIIQKLEEYSAREIKTYVVSYNTLLEKIAEKAGKYACIICKRTMLKVAEKVVGMDRAQGIVTGENLGQVASQTLENLKVLSEAASPIYRPLISMDKEDIIKKAKEIGTLESVKKKRCLFVPNKPATKADINKIKVLEEEIGINELIASVELRCLRR